MNLEAIIERAKDGTYFIYVPDSKHAINGYGETENEAKESLRECINDIVEYCKEQGIVDNLNGGNLEFTYKYDLSAFFESFNMFNISALSKTLGINSDLMRKYKNGQAYISDKRKTEIEQGIHQIAQNLLSVKF